MNFITNIFGRIWALWGIVSFVITFLVVFIPSMLTYLWPEPKSTGIFICIARIWMNVWLRLVGCPVKIKGREHFAKGFSYVVTFNHNSLLDVPLSCPFVPGANKTIAKKSFVKVPLFGWYYRKGAVLVDRKSEQSRRKSFEDMKAVLAKGMQMCIYPEGTRNRTQEALKSFYDGAFRLAVDTNTAVLPAVIFHTKKALPVNKTFFFLPKKLEMHFLPPVPVNGMSVQDMKEKIFAIMSEHYNKHNH